MINTVVNFPELTVGIRYSLPQFLKDCALIASHGRRRSQGFYTVSYYEDDLIRVEWAGVADPIYDISRFYYKVRQDGVTMMKRLDLKQPNELKLLDPTIKQHVLMLAVLIEDQKETFL